MNNKESSWDDKSWNPSGFTVQNVINKIININLFIL